MRAARKRVAGNTQDDWRRLAEALHDPERKWFVAGVFEFQSVPRRLMWPFLRAVLLSGNVGQQRMRRYVLALTAALVVSFGLPQLEVAVACLRPGSEGCVWGHAYFALNVAATALILGVPTFLAVVRFLDQRRKPD